MLTAVLFSGIMQLLCARNCSTKLSDMLPMTMRWCGMQEADAEACHSPSTSLPVQAAKKLWITQESIPSQPSDASGDLYRS